MQIVHLTLNLFMLIAIPLYAQNKPKPQTPPKKSIEGMFKTVQLGMTREQALSELQKDADLEIDESTELGYFDQEKKYIIQAKRHPFIKKIYYQFTQIKEQNPKSKKASPWILYAIIIHFNPHFQSQEKLYSILVQKYGEADKKTPQYSEWCPKKRNFYQTKDGRNAPVKLSLTPPSTIKIIDYSLYLKQSSIDGCEKDCYSNKNDCTHKTKKNQTTPHYHKKLEQKLLKDFASSQDIKDTPQKN